ncbi:MAG: hypothetical protein EPN93_05065 [Spirochaetes bacterium]|nr:MAG: hypothetical protein EPN93_05065 [Spirochaetota bacterium]
MKHPFAACVFCLVVLVSCTTAPHGGIHDPNKSDPVIIGYSAPFLNVRIEGSTMLCTRQKDVTYEKPWSDIPVSSRQRTSTRSMPQEELSALLGAADACGFFTLRDAYGASPDERHYAYEITITRKGTTKAVLFRSNPARESAPKCFVELQEKLEGMGCR